MRPFAQRMDSFLRSRTNFASHLPRGRQLRLKSQPKPRSGRPVLPNNKPPILPPGTTPQTVWRFCKICIDLTKPVHKLPTISTVRVCRFIDPHSKPINPCSYNYDVVLSETSTNIIYILLHLDKKNNPFSTINLKIST